MKRVCILGHFAFGRTAVNGQTIKTQIVTDELVRQLGDNEVQMVDTHGGVKTLLKAPFQVFSSFKTAKNVIILPAHNGVRVYGRLLPLFRGLFKDRKIHYVVIGGWLPGFLKGRGGLAAALKKFDGIYVETSSMKTALEKIGFDNVYVMPNCKQLAVLSEDELIYTRSAPYRLCTFSRVMKEKGIEDAVNAVRVVNNNLGKTVYTLDIYGPVDAGQTEWFDTLKAGFPDYVSYKGCVDADKSVEVLKDYFALLFPTYYEGEGFAGTLIDAFAAGIPVITSDWKYNAEIVDDGITGAVYSLDEETGLEKALLRAVNNVTCWNAMKANCLEKSKCFMPGEALKVIVKGLS